MKKDNWIFWAIGGGSLIVMGFTLYYNYTYAISLAFDQQGIFGDMFGASNALFSGMSFTGVIIAILLQRQELKLQRNELELTREEMKLTRNEFEIQNTTLQIQRFENTFFQMLSMFHDNTEKIVSSPNLTLKFTGKDIFRIIKSQITKGYDSILQQMLKKHAENHQKVKQEDFKINTKEIVSVYQHNFRHFEDHLTKYFGTLHILLKLIDESDLKDKLFYISIIKAQFTNFGTYVIFVHTISQAEDSELRILIDKFGLVDNLDIDLLINPNIFLDYKQKQTRKNLLFLL